MSRLNMTITGYIVEVGDLGMGLKGGKPGRGITLEVDDDDSEVVISGLTKAQCMAAAPDLRKRVQITIVSLPESESAS